MNDKQRLIDLNKPRLIPRDAHYCDGCIWFKNKDGPCRYLPRKACVEAIARFNALRDFCDAIESGELVQVVHGRWVEYRHPWETTNAKKYKCSVCHYGNGDNRPDYCPNCSAKMDGKESENHE